MKNRIIIFAQGKGSRWDINMRTGVTPPAEYKQVLPLGDEVILTRTLRQLDGEDVTVVAGGNLLLYIPGVPFVTLREPTGPLLAGMYRTRHLWERNTILLLGDVVYSNLAIQTILCGAKEACLYGRARPNSITGKVAGELFAMSFCDLTEAERLILSVWNPVESPNTGRLWDVYYWDVRFIEITDFTDDVDSIQEYQQFYSKLEAAALEDDEKLHTIQ